MSQLRKILIGIGGIVVAFIALSYSHEEQALGAPAINYQKELLPQITDTYYVGTTSLVWKGGWFNELCLSGDCKSAWPVGGGGGGGGFPTYFQNGGATLNTATTTVNFTPNSFTVVEDPTDTLTVRVATTTLGLLTTNVGEGSNLYYTDARSRQAISTNILGLSYDSGTGVFSTTSGYFLPTTTRASTWDLAYSWGNHGAQGYITDGNTGWDNSYGFITSGQAVGTTTDGVPGQVPYWTGIRTLGTVATGTLTEAVAGLELDATRYLLGGSAALSLTSGYQIPTTTRMNTWDTAYSWGNHASQGYITDGNTLWDNSYGFITSGQAVSTSSAGVAGQAAYWTSASQIAPVATGTLTESILGIDLDNATRGLFGGSAAFSLTSGYTIPSTTRAATWDTAYSWGNHASAGYDQVTTAGDGLTRTLNDFDCDTASGSVFGCLLSADWTTFMGKVSSSSIDTSSELSTLLTDETGSGLSVFSHNPTFSGTAGFNALTVSATSTLGLASSTALSISGSLWGAGLSSCSDGVTSKLLYNATTGQFSCGTDQSGGGGGSGGGWATTTGTNTQVGELLTYTSSDVLIGGSQPTTTVFNFDPESARFTISSTTSATGTIDSSVNAIRFGSSTGEQVELNWNLANTLRLFSGTGINTFDFGDIRASSTYASTSVLTVGQICLSGDCKTAWPTGGGGGSNWLFDGTRLTPSTTPVGIAVLASSTIGDGTGTGGLTISGDATTTGSHYIWGSQFIGYGNGVTTDDVLTVGYNNYASGTGAVAFGQNTKAGEQYAFAGGDSNTLSAGVSSIAFGTGVKATGDGAAAFGSFNESHGVDALSTGYTNKAGVDNLDNYNVAIGGSQNIAEDDNTVVLGGIYSKANAYNSVVIGGDNSGAQGTYSTVIGPYASTSGSESVVIGSGVTSAYANRLKWSTDKSLAVGFDSTIPTFVVTGGSGAGTLGKVGIGTTSPSRLLTVGGDIYAVNVTATGTASSSALVVDNSINIFGGGAKTTANDLCIQLTGSADLCDGGDASGGGGGSISTSSIPVTGNLAFWSSPSTLTDVATGTLTETVTGLNLSATQNLIGGAAILQVDSGYSLASTSDFQRIGFALASSTGLSATAPLSYNAYTGAFSIPAATGGANGYLTSTDWTAFNAKVSSTSLDTSAELAALLTDETGSANGGLAVFSHAPTFTGTAAFNALTVSATSTLGFASSTALTVSGNAWLNLASSTGFSATRGTFTSATTTNLAATTINLFGGGAKETANELCIQLTGSANLCDGSDDGAGGAGESSDWQLGGPGYIVPTTTVGIVVSASSTIGDGSLGLSINGSATTTGNSYIAGNLGIGTTTGLWQAFGIQKTGISDGQFGISTRLGFTPGSGAVNVGDRLYIDYAPTAGATLLGSAIYVNDSSSVGNLVRGLQVNSRSGSNIAGTNEAISAFAKTFAVKGSTDSTAAASTTPAGVFAENTGTTAGNALRAYSGTMTSGRLVSFYQDTSTFTGDALVLSMASTSGTFTGNFLNFTNGSNRVLTVNSSGWLGIGSSTPSRALTVNGDIFTANITATGTASSSALVVSNSFNLLGTVITNVATWFSTQLNAVTSFLATAASTWDFGGAASLEIPNGTGPTVDAAGELALDTTDDQLLMADSGGTVRVFGHDEFRVVSLTIASSSARFASAQTLPVLGNKDGLEITQYRCYVVGGTSKVVNLTDGTNDTETITCGTTMTSDTDVATNDTFTADELGYLEMGATTGTVDYLHFEAYARIVRE